MRGLWFIDALVRLFVAAGKVHARETGRQVSRSAEQYGECSGRPFFPVRSTGTLSTFFSDRTNSVHSFILYNRGNFDLQGFTQEAFCAKQNTESVGSHMLVEMLAGFPFRNQVENIDVFDVAENIITQTALFLFRWLDQ